MQVGGRLWGPLVGFALISQPPMVWLLQTPNLKAETIVVAMSHLLLGKRKPSERQAVSIQESHTASQGRCSSPYFTNGETEAQRGGKGVVQGHKASQNLDSPSLLLAFLL